MWHYPELFANKKERIAVFISGILIGTLMSFLMGAKGNSTFISIYSIAMFVTIICWYGNKYISYVLEDVTQWNDNPLRRILLVFLANGTYTALSIIIAIYAFFYTNPYFEQEFLNAAIKWGLIVGGLTSLFLNTFYTGLYFFDKWKISLVETERLKRENTQAQLHALRSQVNPHFLFNSLNTLTTLIREDADKATQYVQNFSNFYRYTLQSQENELSTLHEEIKAVKIYLKMQEERFNENLIVNFDIPDHKNQALIPTLSLQILVENCIKHNIINQQNPLQIDISIIDHQFLKVKNNLQLKPIPSNSTGLGLKNIQKRYEYLADSEVKINQSENAFTVQIPLIENL